MSATNFFRDEALLKLRSEVQFEAQKALPAELFQGNTLRPILKFQNEWLLMRMNEYISKKKKDFSSLRPEARNQFIDHAVKFDKLFRAELTGAVYGLMTAEEARFVNENKTDVSKRLTQLIVERYVSQIDQLL
ncbi:MAG: hypothetical protein ACRC3B_11575 [Bacteroidia bacterium]